MMNKTDKTHNPHLHSWVESANRPNTDFPIQNLPFGVFRPRDSTAPARIGVAIGNQILDLSACQSAGLLQPLSEPLQTACIAPNLDLLIRLGRPTLSTLRAHLSKLLQYEQDKSLPASTILVAMSDAELLLPATVGDYTDFYASLHHATNVGKLFRPNNPLLPNYKHIPIAYHGRASSIVPSGTSINRPQGQIKSPDDTAPHFSPCKLLDYEMEVGFWIGPGNEIGQPIPIDRAEDSVFGLCLVNDWSARDIQAWEYQPLGPFLGKSFATTVSPWVVTLDALAPFRCPAFSRADDDPSPLPYLSSPENAQHGGIDLTVEVAIRSARMRKAGVKPQRISRASFCQMYWTMAQMVAHHTSNGCNLRPGDLLASGTVSGSKRGTQGSLLEMTSRGEKPIELLTGEIRTFLEDGDEIILHGYCQKEGTARIGFGECRGIILPTHKP